MASSTLISRLLPKSPDALLPPYSLRDSTRAFAREKRSQPDFSLSGLLVEDLLSLFKPNQSRRSVTCCESEQVSPWTSPSRRRLPRTPKWTESRENRVADPERPDSRGIPRDCVLVIPSRHPRYKTRNSHHCAVAACYSPLRPVFALSRKERLKSYIYPL